MWVQPLIGVEGQLHVGLGAQVGRGQGPRHVGLLLRPNPMLARQHAAKRQAGPQNRLTRRCRPLCLRRAAGIEQYVRVDVPIAGVEIGGDGHLELGSHGLDPGHQRRDLRPRHHAIVDVAVGRERAECAPRRLPRLP